MINREKAMQDAVNALARLDFGQLVLLQAQLAEHVFNCYQHAQLRQLRADNASNDADPSTSH